MKHQHNVIPSKFLPLGSRRVTLPDGTRAWLINGRTFPSKRDYFDWLEAQRNIADLIDKGSAPEQIAEAAPAESEAANV